MGDLLCVALGQYVSYHLLLLKHPQNLYKYE